MQSGALPTATDATCQLMHGGIAVELLVSIIIMYIIRMRT